MSNHTLNFARLLGTVLLAVVGTAGTLAAEPGPQISRGTNPDRFEITGVPPGDLQKLQRAAPGELARRFVVSVHGAGQTSDPPALFGEHRAAAGKLVFEPRYSLQPGMDYRATFRAADSDKLLVDEVFSIPEIELPPPATVEYLFPSQSVLPENQLKFYVHFSAPMSRGQAYRNVQLFKASGERVEWPFLELDEELWDASGSRFTLFFDPGRIKRGLKPREELGPALEEGSSYRLVIDQSWQDATGQPLARSFVKRFRVVAPDYVQPDPTRWKVAVPAAGSRQPLRVAFEEPLDHAMLMRVIQLIDKDDAIVPVLRVVDEHETRLSLLPEAPWKAGVYTLVTRTNLEDLAGNSIERPFEVDIFEKVEQQISATFHRLKLTIK